MRRWLPAAALAAAALALVVAPRVTSTSSTAAFTDLDTLTGSTVTADACASSTTWSSRVAALDTSGTNRAWQRFSGANSLPSDSYTASAWSATSLTYGAAGALYCDPSTAVTMNNVGDYASSQTRTYSTWGANGTGTLLIWVRGTSTATGLLVSLAEGFSGSSTYVDRTLWVTATGTLSFGGRYGTNSTNEFVTTTSGPAINDGRWHLIAVVMPNTSSTSNTAPTIYVDGAVAPASTTGTVRYRARSSSSTNAAWYIGDNDASRDPTGAPTAAWVGDYDEFVWVTGTPSATLLGATSASLYGAADS
jgi:hypothetical protein